MNSQSLLIEIPYSILQEAKLPMKNAEETICKELAIHLYKEGILSFGNARKLAKMDKIAFHIFLGERKIERDYDLEDYQSDMKEIEKWAKKSL